MTTQAEALDAVVALHSPRRFHSDGYGWTICVEDRQGWPCATLRAIEATEAEKEES